MDQQIILQRAKRLAKESGLTYQQIGAKMGYPPESARQSVSQFLNSTNPGLAMSLRFCDAMDIDLEDLLED